MTIKELIERESNEIASIQMYGNLVDNQRRILSILWNLYRILDKIPEIQEFEIYDND